MLGCHPFICNYQPTFWHPGRITRHWVIHGQQYWYYHGFVRILDVFARCLSSRFRVAIADRAVCSCRLSDGEFVPARCFLLLILWLSRYACGIGFSRSRMRLKWLFMGNNTADTFTTSSILLFGETVYRREEPLVLADISFNRICPIISLVSSMALAGASSLCVTYFGRDSNIHYCAEGATSFTVVVLISVQNMIIMPAVSALLFIRLRAVYSRKKYVLAFFGLCWLFILGLSVFDSARGLSRCVGAVQSTQCFASQPADALAYMATTSYDTLMYGFISWKLASFAACNRWQDRLRSFFTGDGLGWLSKVLLQSGQTYYLWVSDRLSCIARHLK